MNWMRYTALGIGIAFGVFFLSFAIGEDISGDFGGIPDPRDSVLLACGPISLIAATAVAWKYERTSGWWLIAGGISTGILFTIRLIDRPMNLLWIFLVYPLPMLVAGALWVLHAAKSAKAAE
ncbi:MAG: hypothetical protein KAW00_00025 [Dehalococcoidia bacterium]|nr:hypothetical protein [Dehalococcoidia bacterium]